MFATCVVMGRADPKQHHSYSLRFLRVLAAVHYYHHRARLYLIGIAVSASCRLTYLESWAYLSHLVRTITAYRIDDPFDPIQIFLHNHTTTYLTVVNAHGRSLQRAVDVSRVTHIFY